MNDLPSRRLHAWIVKFDCGRSTASKAFEFAQKNRTEIVATSSGDVHEVQQALEQALGDYEHVRPVVIRSAEWIGRTIN